jgi:low affinity Fe/Cu permease
MSMSSAVPSRLTISDRFRVFAARASDRLGSPWAFVMSVLIVLVWLITGPLFRFSDAWQLVINTGTTIVTFLMVFLIQSTQNRDAKATHLKLDELIRSSKARNVFADLEDATEAELDAFKQEFRKLREKRVTPGEAAEVAHRLVHKPGSH